MKNEKREWPESVNREELECLIMWPKHSKGWEEESKAIDALLLLCQSQGFGRIPQLAESIEKIWRDPSLVKKFETKQALFIKTMIQANIS